MPAKARAVLFVIVMLSTCLGTGYGMALMGEPRQQWLWCQLLKAC